MAWVSARVFGYGEAGLRSLSAVFGIATVPVASRAARRLVSPRGVIAAALTACNPSRSGTRGTRCLLDAGALLTSVALLAIGLRTRDADHRAGWRLGSWPAVWGGATTTTRSGDRPAISLLSSGREGTRSESSVGISVGPGWR